MFRTVSESSSTESAMTARATPGLMVAEAMVDIGFQLDIVFIILPPFGFPTWRRMQNHLIPEVHYLFPLASWLKNRIAKRRGNSTQTPHIAYSLSLVQRHAAIMGRYICRQVQRCEGHPKSRPKLNIHKVGGQTIKPFMRKSLKVAFSVATREISDHVDIIPKDRPGNE